MSVPYGGTVITASPRAAGRPVLATILGAACISSSAIFVTLAHVGAVTTAFFRCLLALPVLVLLAVLEQRKLGPRPFASRRSAVIAGLFLAVDLVLWNHAITDVGAGVATVLGNLQVLFVAVFAWLVLRERPGKRYLLTLPVVLGGIVLVSGLLGGHAAGLHPLPGVAFGFGTSAAYACFLLILRTTAGRTPHVAGQLADATIGAAVGSLALGLIFGGLQVRMSWSSLGWLLILALLSGTGRLATDHVVAAAAAGRAVVAVAAAAASGGARTGGRGAARAANGRASDRCHPRLRRRAGREPDRHVG